jgi:dihydroorotate dehydrogenase (fumarate)
MVDLSTDFMGLQLRNPLICSASPLCADLDNLCRMEDAGAAAVVLPSLFEEQLDVESQELYHFLVPAPDGGGADLLSQLPEMREYNRGPKGYLELLRRAKDRLNIPVIASLNGSSPGGWVGFSRQIEQAGADALELNVYWVPADPALSGPEVELLYTDLVSAVKAHVRIPVAVKLNPFFSSFAAFARRLDEARADGVVLFNRFYQPDFDVERLEVIPTLQASTQDDLLLRLHWAAILFGRIKAHIGITGGIHTPLDVIKSLMAGGRVGMLASALLLHGIEYLTSMLRGLEEWMEDHDYANIDQLLGSMSLLRVSDPPLFERANYMKVLRNFATQELPC